MISLAYENVTVKEITFWPLVSGHYENIFTHAHIHVRTKHNYKHYGTFTPSTLLKQKVNQHIQTSTLSQWEKSTRNIAAMLKKFNNLRYYSFYQFFTSKKLLKRSSETTSLPNIYSDFQNTIQETFSLGFIQRNLLFRKHFLLAARFVVIISEVQKLNLI